MTASEPTATLAPGESYASITAQISALTLERRAGRGWWLGFGLSAALLALFVAAIGYLFATGVGIWGLQIPVAWGTAIIDYVWWIAIASGGTLISAIFYLVGAEWRVSIARIAESMMICAAACAGIFPIIHLGRPSLFYWCFPYVSTMGVWPQFRSPLLWDFFALLVYVVASILFWYIGMLPDLATLRDRAPSRGKQVFYGILALGWRGSSWHWRNYQSAYLLMAALLTPTVVSIHSVVGLDFAGGLTPGWHETEFPPFFVFGAMLSGFAVVAALVIPIRAVYRLHNLITVRHLDILGQMILISSIAIAYAYAMETFTGVYNGDKFDHSLTMARLTGEFAPYFWQTVLFNVALPQLLWSRRIRRAPVPLFLICLCILYGMWMERFVIVVSLAHDFMPSMFRAFQLTIWDWATTIGSIGLFLFGVFLFVRLLPVVSMAEMRQLLHERTGGERRE